MLGGDLEWHALSPARSSAPSLAESDLPHLVELAGDNEVARWTAAIPHPFFGEGTAARIWNAPAPKTASSLRSRRARPAPLSVACVSISDAEGVHRRYRLLDRAAGCLLGVAGYWIGEAA